MSGRRRAWICAELTIAAERRLRAAGSEPDREALFGLFWPLSKPLAKKQALLEQAASWYRFVLADAGRAYTSCMDTVDAVAAPHEQQLADLEQRLAEDERTPE